MPKVAESITYTYARCKVCGTEHTVSLSNGRAFCHRCGRHMPHQPCPRPVTSSLLKK